MTITRCACEILFCVKPIAQPLSEVCVCVYEVSCLCSRLAKKALLINWRFVREFVSSSARKRMSETTTTKRGRGAGGLALSWIRPYVIGGVVALSAVAAIRTLIRVFERPDDPKTVRTADAGDGMQKDIPDGALIEPFDENGREHRLSMKGKVVVVTGASSGIGRAVARAFHARGAIVVVGARRINRLKDLVKELDPKDTGTAIAVQTDVTISSDVKRLVQTADKLGRGVDVLVNVAGVMYFTLMKNVKEKDWNQTVDVNVKGVLNGFAAVLPGMVSRKRGHIITISSDAGRRIFPKLAVYCASVRSLFLSFYVIYTPTCSFTTNDVTFSCRNILSKFSRKPRDANSSVRDCGSPRFSQVIAPPISYEAIQTRKRWTVYRLRWVPSSVRAGEPKRPCSDRRT